MNLRQEQKENRILKVLERFKGKDKKPYRTKCIFCKREITTYKNTANEGICLSCRSC